MANLTAEERRELELICQSISAYGALRAKTWSPSQVAQIRSEVSAYDGSFAIVRFFWRFFSFSQIERKRAWLFYQDTKDFLGSLSSGAEVDAAGCQNFLKARSAEVQHLSFFSRLKKPAKQLLAFLQKLIPKLTATVAVGPAIAATAAAPAAVLPGVAASFARELAAFSRLCADSAADKKEIKKEYFRLALKYHPDRAGDLSKERFQELKACYDHYLDPLSASTNAEDRGWGREEKVNAENAHRKIDELERWWDAELAKMVAQNSAYADAACAELRADRHAIAEMFGITPEQLAKATQSAAAAADSVAPPAKLTRG